MRKLIGLSLALLLAVPVVAMGEQVKGQVKSVDKQSNTIVLDDGTQLWVSEGVAQSVSPGETILSSYSSQGDKKVSLELERRTMSPDGFETTNFGGPAVP
jgi:small nuclear ribonucleoprotein (snRNP)-like protein